jgi:hypothetical protein
VKTAYECLDKIDLSSILNPAFTCCRNIDDLLYCIEDNNIDIIFAMNVMDKYDWMTYLEARYNMRFTETTTYTMDVIGDKIYKKENSK